MTDENITPTGESSTRDDALIDAAWKQVVTPPGSSGQVMPGAGAGPPPDSFTGYKIVKEIHRGGQGVVYQAIHESTKRKVAIKVMREGPFAGSSDRARFDREVQILGQLQHPYIVGIHDTGLAAGSHFFVMDYISGQPLDVYMASPGAPGRSVDETLRLFQKICQAINAAHLRGIIHRDLKPSNIRIDQQGDPHVLDFGLAKVATTADEASVMTMTGEFVGSFPWASPEQAEGIPSKIDVRTDVYSLGVVLYQMLTGKFPYEIVGSVRDVLDRIMTAEPIPPRTLRRAINDEVETIVLKCLQKERDRRYQSAGELARDVQHYCNDEPIEAKRDSLGYMLRKQLRKYRVPVAIAAILFVVVTAGLVTSLLFWQQAALQRDAAVEAREQQKREAAKSDAVSRFLQDMLASVSPWEQGKDVSVREVLDAAAEKLSGEFVDQPLVRAQLHRTIGETYLPLGDSETAKDHLQTALGIFQTQRGEHHEDTADVTATLGLAHYVEGDFQTAERLLSAGLDDLRATLGENHKYTLEAMNSLGLVYWKTNRLEKAEALFREAHQRREAMFGIEHRSTLTCLNNLALVLDDRGRLEESKALHKRVLETRRRVLGEDHPDFLFSLGNYAWLLYQRGDAEQAETLFRQAVDIARRVFGEEHQMTTSLTRALVKVQKATGQTAEALETIRKLLADRRARMGDDDPEVLYLMDDYATMLQNTGDLDGAEEQFRATLAGIRRVLGEQDPGTLGATNNLALVCMAQNKLTEAEELFAYVLAGLPDDPNTFDQRDQTRGVALWNYGATLHRLERLDEAERALLEAYPLLEMALGPANRHAMSTAGELGKVLKKLDDPARAEQAKTVFEDLLRARREKHGDDDPGVLAAMSNTALVLQGAGDLADAEALFREALTAAERTLGQQHQLTAQIMNNLAFACAELNRLTEAEELYVETLKRYDNIENANPRSRPVTLQGYGIVLRKLGKLDEAEPVLLEAHATLAQHFGPAESARRVASQLAELYEQRGDPDKAATWRAKLPKDSKPESSDLPAGEPAEGTG